MRLEDWVSQIIQADLEQDYEAKLRIAKDADDSLVDQLQSVEHHGDWAAASLKFWKSGKLKPTTPPPSDKEQKIAKLQAKSRPRVTDENGDEFRVVEVVGDQVVLENGKHALIDSIALPLMLDPNLVNCLDLLKTVPLSISAEDAWPMVVVWNGLSAAERCVVRNKLRIDAPNALDFWKQSQHLWKQRSPT